MKISFFIPNLYTAGAENVLILVINQLVNKYPDFEFHLCISDKSNTRLNILDSRIKILNFSKSKLRYCLIDLILYLKKESPQYFISALDYANLLASFAHKCSFVDTKLILWEHNVTSIHGIKTISKIKIIRYILVNFLYNRAQYILCVSKGILCDLIKSFNIKNKKLLLVYNPVDHNRINKLSVLSNHKVNAIIEKGSYILSIGRLAEAKNFSLLIRAFNNVKNIVKYKLIIMGDGPLRSDLNTLIKKLNLSNHVYLIGHFSNPYIFIKNSKAVISSSNWEGLPLNLIESLALGKYIISTDCPHGPREILDNGNFGTLVPTDNVELLSKAIKDIPSNSKSFNEQKLIERSKYFSINRSLEKLGEIFED